MMRLIVAAIGVTMGLIDVAVRPQVTLRDETGAVLARLPAPASRSRLELRYRHSVYGRPGAEIFIVDRTGLRLTELRSPSEAVLEYYGRPEPVRPAPDGFVIHARDASFRSLRLLPSAIGARTLVFAGRTLRLDRLAGSGVPVTLAVGRVVDPADRGGHRPAAPRSSRGRGGADVAP